MANYYYPTSKNAIQKTLAAQLLNTASTGDAITFDDVDGVQNKPGVLVINRIDGNGVATPSSREYVSFTGTSGNTVLIETRNVDGSGAARTHAVGSIVEFISDVVWGQRVIDQALVEHNTDGTHKTATVTTLKATGAEVTTGTSDVKIVTPKALADAGIVAASLATDALWAAEGDLVKGTANNAADILSIGSVEAILRVVSGTAAWTTANFKVGTFSRDATASSGSVAYTGVGFIPKAIIFLAVISATTKLSIGLDDGTSHGCIQIYQNNLISGNANAISVTDASNGQDGNIASFNSDGFTIAWTKNGSPTGTISCYYLAFR